MGLRNYTSALALSALLGCSVPSESSDYVTADLPTAQEEALLQKYDPRPSSLDMRVADIFRGNKVVITYKTNDGPGSRIPYVSIDSHFVEGVEKDLIARGAFVSRVGNPNGDYTDINLRENPQSAYNGALVVIADRNSPNVEGIDKRLLGDVYLASLKDGVYKFERATK